MPNQVKLKKGDRVQATGFQSKYGKGTVKDYSIVRNEIFYHVKFDTRSYQILVSEMYLRKI